MQSTLGDHDSGIGKKISTRNLMVLSAINDKFEKW